MMDAIATSLLSFVPYCTPWPLDREGPILYHGNNQKLLPERQMSYG